MTASEIIMLSTKKTPSGPVKTGSLEQLQHAVSRYYAARSHAFSTPDMNIWNTLIQVLCKRPRKPVSNAGLFQSTSQWIVGQLWRNTTNLEPRHEDVRRNRGMAPIILNHWHKLNAQLHPPAALTF